MTVKLYENDSLRRTCQATVVACEQRDDHYEIVLDRTVIFPEGGGQLSDQGKIDDVDVYYAADDGADVRHYTKQPLPVGQAVTVTLDWDLRLDRMQQHCGEHILSYAFWKLYGANNVGFHMHEDSVFIDLDQTVDEDMVKKAELMANECVWANEPITLHYVPHTELSHYPLRKHNDKLRGTIRLVEIRNGDICTCCGTHPPYTGMVGAIQIIRVSHHKEGSRVEFLCGKRALLAMHERNQLLEKTSDFLSVKVRDIFSAIQRLHQEILDLKSLNREKTQALFQLQLPEKIQTAPVLADGTKVVFLTLEGSSQDGKSAMKLLTAEKQIFAAIVVKDGARLSYQFARSEGASGDCKACCTLANDMFQGRGGGRPQSAQGGAPADKTWQQKAARLQEQVLTELREK